MEKEIWEPIPEWEDYYEASSLGRIRSKERFVNSKNDKLRKAPSKIRKFQLNYNNGYYVVAFSRNGKIKVKDVHRLIALTLVPGYFKGAIVNHIDGNKLNNKSSNLEWVTYSTNRVHAILTGLSDDRGENSKNSKLKLEEVLEIRRLRKEEGLKILDIHKLFPKVHKDYITLIINRRRWKHV